MARPSASVVREAPPPAIMSFLDQLNPSVIFRQTLLPDVSYERDEPDEPDSILGIFQRLIQLLSEFQ